VFPPIRITEEGLSVSRYAARSPEAKPGSVRSSASKDRPADAAVSEVPVWSGLIVITDVAAAAGGAAAKNAAAGSAAANAEAVRSRPERRRSGDEDRGMGRWAFRGASRACRPTLAALWERLRQDHGSYT
jgi:hypothetical protein